MTKLPEFLRSRLALRQNQPDDHPNAGLLAAFREHSLPARERSDLLEHLAGCAECREILAAASAPDISRAPGIARWKWRWAVAVTAACLVAALFWQPGSIQNQSWNIALAPPPAPAAPKEEEPKTSEKQPAKKHIVPGREAAKQPIVQAALPLPPEPVIPQPEPPPVLQETANAPPREAAPPPAEPEKKSR